jgi:hypothetical protein
MSTTTNYRYGGSKAQFGISNTIPTGSDSQYSYVFGSGNTMVGDADGRFIAGGANILSGGAKYSTALGYANELDNLYGFAAGQGNDIKTTASGAWGAAVIGKGNRIAQGDDGCIVMGISSILNTGGAASTGRGNIVAGYGIEHYGGGGGVLAGGYFTSLGKFGDAAVDIGAGCFTAGNVNKMWAVHGAVLGDQNTCGVTGNRKEGRDSLAMGRQVHAKYAGGLTFGGGAHSAVGDSQSTLAVAKTQTTDATATELLFGDGSNTHRAIIANDTTAVFEALIVGRQTDADDNSGAYKIQGAIDNNATTVALVGVPTVTTIGEDTAGWAVSAEEDDVNKSLKLIVTGAVGDAVNWTGQLNIIEVTG